MPNNPRFELTSFGESLLRFSVAEGKHLETMTNLDVYLGGAEINLCSALAALNRKTAWLSALPDNPLADFTLRQLRAANINIEAVIKLRNSRLGTYYIEFAKPPRATNVIYDRASSAITKLRAEDINWDYLLDTKVLHLTGITPALSEELTEIVLEIIKRAKAKGIIISFDVNYRSKLWSSIKAAKVLKQILPDVDILICGEADAIDLFGLNEVAKETLLALAELSDAKHIILSQASKGASTLINDELVQIKAKKVDVIDRLGAGDAFAAGVIDGYLDGDIVQGMQRGIVLSAFVLGQYGDMLATNRAELDDGLLGRDSIRR